MILIIACGISFFLLCSLSLSVTCSALCTCAMHVVVHVPAQCYVSPHSKPRDVREEALEQGVHVHLIGFRVKHVHVHGHVHEERLGNIF